MEWAQGHCSKLAPPLALFGKPGVHIPTMDFRSSGQFDCGHDGLFERCRAITPGGVHSPVRSFKNLSCSPRFIQSAEGAYVRDVEGKDYLDFCMSFGPLILGHRPPPVEAALREQLQRGWTYGACEPYSLNLAEYLTGRLPFVEQIRFVNSGTEAVMTALRLARGHTGRPKVIKFDGCYHGHSDGLLVRTGSGLAEQTESTSAGIPAGVAAETLVLELDDLAAAQTCFQRFGADIAAAIVEPLPANCGLLPQRREFLHGLRGLCQQHGSLFIADEVISGFRAGFGGISEAEDLAPDLVTYGKIIGGGLPVGAVAGKREFMGQLAPEGSVYQAGTLSANPLAMAAGLATLNQLTPESYRKLRRNTGDIATLLEQWFQRAEGGRFAHYRIVHSESLFWPVPTAKREAPIRRASDIPSKLSAEFAPLFMALLDRGVYLSPNAYEVNFVSLAHDSSAIGELERRLFQ